MTEAVENSGLRRGFRSELCMDSYSNRECASKGEECT